MRNKILLKRFVIAVAAALFAGLAGNAQAVPITLRSLAVNQAPSSARTINHKQSSAGFLAASVPTLGVTQKAGLRGTATLGNTHRRGGVIVVAPVLSPVPEQGAYPLSGLNAPLLPPVPVLLPQPPVFVLRGGGAPVKSAVSVPDGGMTAMMLGASFCGLALMRKKLEA